jgi:hypothetical protein
MKSNDSTAFIGEFRLYCKAPIYINSTNYSLAEIQSLWYEEPLLVITLWAPAAISVICSSSRRFNAFPRRLAPLSPHHPVLRYLLFKFSLVLFLPAPDPVPSKNAPSALGRLMDQTRLRCLVDMPYGCRTAVCVLAKRQDLGDDAAVAPGQGYHCAHRVVGPLDGSELAFKRCSCCRVTQVALRGLKLVCVIGRVGMRVMFMAFL